MSVSEDMTPTFSIAGLLTEDMTSTFSTAGLLAEFMMPTFSIAGLLADLELKSSEHLFYGTYKMIAFLVKLVEGFCRFQLSVQVSKIIPYDKFYLDIKAAVCTYRI